MKPLVSILIPAYNSEAWLADTLRSAIAQTWDRKEIIVVDDGSTDSTLALARQFAPQGVSVFAQQNHGAAAARNKAFSLSRGDYIQWLDADDLLTPNKIASQMEVMARFPGKRTLLSSAWGRFKYRHYRAKFIPSSLWCDLSPLEWLVRKLAENVYMQTATWLASRELTEAAGTWDTRLLGDDDGEYFCRVILASDSVRFVPDAKVLYRMAGSDSLSYVGGSNRKLEAQWISMKLHVGYLRSLEDSDRTRAACVKYLQNWLVFFYPERSDVVGEAVRWAVCLGGRLEVPRFSWKYSWIAGMFGPRTAKRAQITLSGAKGSMALRGEKVLFQIERRLPGGRAGTQWNDREILPQNRL